MFWIMGLPLLTGLPGTALDGAGGMFSIATGGGSEMGSHINILQSAGLRAAPGAELVRTTRIFSRQVIGFGD